jgi:flagellin-like hook-associated protein FlgL
MRITPTTMFLTMDRWLDTQDQALQSASSLLRRAADIAESVMDLQMAQNGYQAVLGALSRLSMPSLLDFLR